MVPFELIESTLRKALMTFGPVRRSNHPEYPFWHLQNDEIWEVQSEGTVTLRQRSANPTAKELRTRNAHGGFLSRYYDALKTSAILQNDLIHDILDTHFPISIHDEIVDFFGLLIRSADTNEQLLSSQYRQQVLIAYDGVCAVSNFNVRMEGVIFGVEAAHLLWPQAGGKNIVSNAIAMTSLHRKLFHLGVFTIDSNYRVRISTFSKGGNGFNELLGQFNGKKISLPVEVSDHPNLEALRWHQEEVFRH